MEFWLVLLALAVLFIAMFWVVKSGRLTLYRVAVEAGLVKAEPILSTVEGFDFSRMLTPHQQGWVLFTATVLLGIARKRREIREAMGFPMVEGN